MNSLIRAELLKLRTTRAVHIATAIALLWAVTGPALITWTPSDAMVPDLDPSSLAELMRGPARLAGGAMLLVGLLASAGEFRHGTVLTTRLATPRSLRVLVAKTCTLALVGFAVGVVVELFAFGSGALALSGKGIEVQPFAHGVLTVAALVPALVAVHAALGVAVGSLLRNTAAAVGVTLGWAFVVEGLLPMVLRQPTMANWLPGGAVSQVLAAQTEPGQLAPAAAAALLAGYAVVLIVSSVAVDRVREL